jgi:Polyketide cyclase / dehydrase and lipid transport.
MNDVTVERDIAAPAEKVWGLISDITRMGEWSPEARGGAWVKGASAPAVGARFKGKNARGKRSWSTDCRVTECEPGSRFAFDVTALGLAVAAWSYTLTDTPTGCHVVETWTDPRGGLMKRLGTVVSGVSDRASHNRDGMEQTLTALAAAAE